MLVMTVKTKESSVQALERILAVVDAVSREPSGVPPAWVAEECGLSLSTVIRLLQSLCDEEVLVRSGTTGQFRVGPRLIRIVGRATHSFDVRAATAPILDQLRDTSGGETASLHVRNGYQRLCIAAAYTTHPSGRIVPVGLPLPLYGSAVGYVLLSQLGDDTFEEVVGAMSLTAKARKVLQSRVEDIRRNGYAESVDESVEGVRGVAVPIGGQDDWGALSLSGPSDRFVAKLVPGALESLYHAAEAMADANLRPSAIRLL